MPFGSIRLNSKNHAKKKAELEKLFGMKKGAAAAVPAAPAPVPAASAAAAAAPTTMPMA